MKKENQFNFSVGKLAVAAVGGYLLWINRFKIQQLLEENGVSTPWMTDNLAEAANSGAAKIAGSIQHEAKAINRSFD